MTDTGAALAAAIAANPDDAAPWLVYADWLLEAGRDAEADAVRAHLPALRDAVRNGYDPATVLSTAVECPPGHPMWNLMFGLPAALGVPKPIPEPAPPAPSPDPWVFEAPAEPVRSDPAWWPLLAVIVIVGMGLLRGVPTPPDQWPRPIAFPTRDWTAAQTEPPALRRPLDAREALQRARLPAPGRRWDSAEVSGYSFRLLPGVNGNASFTFRADGTVVRNDAPGPSAERWTIGPDGDLQVIGANSTVTARLVKLRQVEDVYDIEVNGHTNVYIRLRP